MYGVKKAVVSITERPRMSNHTTPYGDTTMLYALNVFHDAGGYVMEDFIKAALNMEFA